MTRIIAHLKKLMIGMVMKKRLEKQTLRYGHMVEQKGMNQIDELKLNELKKFLSQNEQMFFQINKLTKKIFYL